MLVARAPRLQRHWASSLQIRAGPGVRLEPGHAGARHARPARPPWLLLHPRSETGSTCAVGAAFHRRLGPAAERTAVSGRRLSWCVHHEWHGAWARVATYVRNEVTCSNLSSFQPCTVHRIDWNEVIRARCRAGLQTWTRRMQGGE